MSSEMPSRYIGFPGVEDRHFFRVQDANALMARLNRFFRDVDDLAAFQGLAIFFDEKLGLWWPKIVVAFADKRSPRPAEQVFTRAIKPHEPQRRALLDEQHERNVVDDCVEGCVGSLEFFFDALALSDIPQRHREQCLLADLQL